MMAATIEMWGEEMDEVALSHAFRDINLINDMLTEI